MNISNLFLKKVIELYKDTVPDILGVALGIDMEDVHNLTAKDVKEKLDLTLRYEVNPENSNTQLVEYKEDKWYKKVFSFIKKFFRK